MNTVLPASQRLSTKIVGALIGFLITALFAIGATLVLVGFDAGTLLQKGDNHVGINIMRERAQRIHASFDVTSEPRHGTTVLLQLPQELRRAA